MNAIAILHFPNFRDAPTLERRVNFPLSFSLPESKVLPVLTAGENPIILQTGVSEI
jgi:hypothetical protein